MLIVPGKWPGSIPVSGVHRVKANCYFITSKWNYLITIMDWTMQILGRLLRFINTDYTIKTLSCRLVANQHQDIWWLLYFLQTKHLATTSIKPYRTKKVNDWKNTLNEFSSKDKVQCGVCCFLLCAAFYFEKSTYLVVGNHQQHQLILNHFQLFPNVLHAQYKIQINHKIRNRFWLMGFEDTVHQKNGNSINWPRPLFHAVEWLGLALL